MSAVGKWMSPACRIRGHVAHVLLHARPQGVIFVLNVTNTCYFGRPPAFYQRQSGPMVGRVTDRCQGPYHHVAHVITWAPPLRRYFALSENSIFYTFCILSWPQITNGGIDADHISHGDDHVHGSSTRAHKVASPATWHVPEGVKHFR